MSAESEGGQDEGFSLVEVLVVIVIIAILASIAIPVFLRQREKGFRAQLESALKNAGTAMQSWATENEGDYGGVSSDLSDLEPGGTHDQGLRFSDEIELRLEWANDAGYCVSGRHDNLPMVLYFGSSLQAPTPSSCA